MNQSFGNRVDNASVSLDGFRTDCHNNRRGMRSSNNRLLLETSNNRVTHPQRPAGSFMKPGLVQHDFAPERPLPIQRHTSMSAGPGRGSSWQSGGGRTTPDMGTTHAGQAGGYSPCAAGGRLPKRGTASTHHQAWMADIASTSTTNAQGYERYRFQTPGAGNAMSSIVHHPGSYQSYNAPIFEGQQDPGAYCGPSFDQYSRPLYGEQAWGKPSLPPQGPRITDTDHSPGPSTQIQTGQRTPSTLPKHNSTDKGDKSVTTATKRQNDNSVRFITATIQGTRHWSQFSHRVAFLFEVFGGMSGMVNSAVSMHPGNLETSFILKDDKDSINCTFFQIDRQLQRLVRGQWYRCVGTPDDATRSFKCVSVRPAEKSELKVYKKQIHACDKTMRFLVNTLTET